MKTLCTKTLPSARRLTKHLAPNVFSFVSNVFYSQLAVFENMPSLGTADPQSALEPLSMARVALKCLRRLMIHGFDRFSQEQQAIDLWGFISEHLPRVLRAREPLVSQSPSPLVKLIDSFIVLVGKLCLDAGRERVIDYCLVPACIALTKYYGSILESSLTMVHRNGFTDFLMQNVQIQSIKILKNLVNHQEFSIVTESETPFANSRTEDRDPRLDSALVVLETSLFTPQFVVGMAKLLVTQYLPLDHESMLLWANEPEEFVQEEESDHWEFNLRACAEKLLIVLFSKNRAILCPYLIEVLTSLPQRGDWSGVNGADASLEAVRFREAVYCATGICAHDLYDYLNFDDWLNGRLLGESQIKDENWTIMRRRIAIVVSSWVGIKSSKGNRHTIYQMLLSFLQPEEDLVVRLTSVTSLRVVLDDFDFEVAVFAPFLSRVTDCFMRLLGDVDEFDSKMKIINCLIVVIERMEGQILPSVTPLLQILPDLWMRSDGQNLFRSSIVTIVAKLVKTLRGESQQLHPMVIPILQESLDTTKPGHLYLLEEGLELWLSTLQNAAGCSHELLHLLPAGISLLEYGTESLKRVLHILEAYIVLSPLQTLQLYAEPLIDAITRMLGTLTVNASNALLRLVDIMLQSCQSAGVFPSLLQIMYTKGLFTRLLTVVLAGEEMNIIVVGFLMVLSRMMVYDAGSVLQILHASGEGAVDRFLDVLIEKYDTLGHVKQRKLHALAMISLVGTGQAPVMARSMLFTFETRDGDDDEGSLDYSRRRKLMQEDLLYAHNSYAPYLKLKFDECERVLGNPGLITQLAQSDHDIAVQMDRILNSSLQAPPA
ncbi:Importin-11 [Kappamyces sp. JEL0680]|nr:Importin-11 [Kappamyces sp. JEL0680]